MMNSQMPVICVPLLSLLLVSCTEGAKHNGNDETPASEVQGSPQGGDHIVAQPSAGGAGGQSGSHPIEIAPGECRNDTDCADPVSVCFGATEFPIVGVCFDVAARCAEGACTQCEEDSDCAASAHGSICEPQEGSCRGGRTCRPGCEANDECEVHETCDEGGRCEAKECTADLHCPADFSCGDGYCTRTNCSTDSDCDNVCVNERCQEGGGYCSPPALP